MPTRCPPTRRSLKIFGLLALTIFLLPSFHYLPLSTRRFDTWRWTPCPPGSSPFKDSCNIHRALISHGLLVVVKTGGTEPLNRLRYQLATVLSEIPADNLLIFSDLEENVGAYHVHDVFANISEVERKRYPEFKLYDELLAYKAEGKDTRALKGGWQLDRYKNLPMKRMIWRMQQDRGRQMDWFLFIDTDTFIEWDNLLGLLENLDPSKTLYMGSPVWVRGQAPNISFEFAHGGSAYVLSYGALKILNTVETPDAPGSMDPSSPAYSQYGLPVEALCCGDDALARAFVKRGVRMKGYWPMFNGEVPATAPYGNGHWCEPVISLHHISEQNMDSLWHWIAAWKDRTMNKQPLLWRDLFDYVAAEFSPRRDDWENTQDPHNTWTKESFEDCKAACEADPDCFQFVFHGKTCKISHSIRLGRPHKTDQPSDERYFSGWNMTRIRDWTSKTQCESAHWVHSNP
ncbi:hypothetical protein BUE80_DR003096 [Diplocarpon rosae]|nr:hypothetical protein BUE80_DR003096 [Diplocarpon rosae]